jgi:Glycosyltransferase WbsX
MNRDLALTRIAKVMVALALCCGVHAWSASSDLKVGVFYFPGWKDNLPGHPYPNAWGPLKAFPDRQPELGWYEDGDSAVARQHMSWMTGHGIDYVVYDWYWDGKKPVMDHALKAYQGISGPKPQFAVMWPNHASQPTSGAFFYSMVRYWIDEYFNDPNYLRINGKPAAFIMLGNKLDEKAQAFGSTSTELLARADAMAVAAGLPGIYFLSGGGAHWILEDEKKQPKGFSAYFAYNYHSGPDNRIKGISRPSHSFAELDDAYQQHWAWLSAKGNAPFVLPLTAGWDKRPWGGSADPMHDKSTPSLVEFKRHLAAGRRFLEPQPRNTLGMALICCWNEFGEGSYVEPTVGIGKSRLEAIKEVFRN